MMKDNHRRGACPGLSAPMATGDGLLVRFSPIGTISLDAFGALCDAAKRYGNGVIEVTARGNIQVRGLSAASAPDFEDAIAELDIAAEDGIPIVCNPLAGLDPAELIDTGTVAADLRKTLARSSLASRLSPKVSIAIDCGGAYQFNVPADIRLRVLGNGRLLEIEVAGHQLGAAAVADVVVVVMRLLEIVARHGRQARARDIISAEGITTFRDSIADLLFPIDHHERGEPASNSSLCGNEPSLIGACRLRDGSYAYCIALPFGHADGDSLQQLTAAARTSGARGFRVAPGRAMLVIGVTEEKFESFVAAAKDLGLIVDAADPRRYVVACAGAPICASAHIAARTMGPTIAAAVAMYLDSGFKIHISGCAKGCAHPSPAALTIVGAAAGCALVANGSARDTPFMSVAVNELTGKIPGLVRDLKSGAGRG
jgi:precorrin-3B synthase